MVENSSSRGFILVCCTFAVAYSACIGSFVAAEESEQFHYFHGGELVAAESGPLQFESAFESPSFDSTASLTSSIDAPSFDPDVESSILDEDAEESEDEEEFANFYERHLMYESYYRLNTDSTSYLPGKGDDFGWISFEGIGGLNRDENFSIISRLGIHFLSGPLQTDIPPRLYDLGIGLQVRDEIGPFFAYDFAANIALFTDFEDSAREGVQFPGHAVGFLRATPAFQFVFGVDYFGQDDIKILPVIGLRLKSFNTYQLPLVDAELVFPRPRISVILTEGKRIYISGKIGGGSWDIERPDESNDVFTYRDHRVAIGWDSIDEDDGEQQSFEIGYSFNRRLTFRHDPLDLPMDDALFIRFVTTK